MHRFKLSDISRILRNALRDTDEPEEVLQALGDMRRAMVTIEERAVAACIAQGMSYASIAVELGVSRQAVQQRWGHLRSVAS